MKREYQNPRTAVSATRAMSVICVSAGGGSTPSYENLNAGGGDPEDAI